ncbi:tubulin epsilon and delta complex protein 2-like isoform X3 [Acanthochromis polyacanthus]|uniref:tubulin epsilon and delta complex protein 2-like isoform X3 n=1 Tax=Acanthochromis polyacanthus TaxID=80966 RepID=UPI000B8F1F43|nr:tubulin epsilon and delta complex protein 2-like isoform X3 [Acanthochromis polyacanthus]
MSLLSSVELLIKMYKEEQVQINARTEVYREILRSLTPEPNTSPDGSEPADEAAADADVSPQEKEDIELLERVLQKALRVLTSSEPSKAGSGGEKLSGPGREVSVSSAAAKGRKPTAVKSASLDRKQLRRPGSCSTLASRLSAGSRPSSSAGPASLSRNHQLRGDQSKAASGSTPSDCRELQQSRSVLNCSADNKTSCSQINYDLWCLHPARRPSEHAARWRSVRNKQNRLWDKVSAVQRRPAAGRSVFMDRLRALFPSEWPSGSPDRTRAVDRPTHQDHQDPRSRTPETASESGGRDEEFGSCETPAEVQTSAHRVEQEWKAWDRWRPGGGRLCSGVSGGITAPLPLTVTYTTEAELQQLEELRLKVALLQQDVYLEQVLLDSLSSRLWSGGAGGLDPGVLRGLYSLLAEGGQRFPAVVLDSE